MKNAISKKLVIPALLLIAIGFLVAVVPWTVAPVCEVHTAENPNGLWVVTMSNKTLPMPCGYTARAEIGVGAAAVVFGGALLFAASAATVLAFGVIGIVLGGLTMALPDLLTKTCALSSHTCNTMTLPSLNLLGIAMVGISVGLIAYKGKLFNK
jgi:hypothetical protein